MSWAHYILQVNIYLVVFYGFYKLLLDKETYFSLNRIYLVSAGVLSLVIPYLRFDWFTKQAVVQPVYISVGQLMGQVTIIQEESNVFSAGNLIVMVYLLGILFFASRFILRLLALNRKLKQPEHGDAFSFFSKKRIDARLPQSKTVHKHEDTHICQGHSIDVIFFEVLSIFTWFNPIIYCYKNAIKSIHEYIADEVAARFQGDKDEYALLLLSRAFGVPVNTLANSFFNQSLIKKRIFMLHKQRSRKTSILKYGLAIPLFAITLVMSSATIRNNDKIQRITDNIPLNSPLEVVNEVVTASIGPIAPQLAKRMRINSPVEVQGWDEFYKFMRISIRYPAIAQKNNMTGTTMLKFTIAHGQVEDAGIVASLGGGTDIEVMRCILAFTGYKSIDDGKYTIKVKFTTTDTDAPAKNGKIPPLKGYTALNEINIIASGARTASNKESDQQNQDEESMIYDFVSIETQPSFPGGIEKLFAYLRANIRFPAEAIKNNVQGKVFLSFIVEKDGTLTNIKVERKLGSGTDEEAIRVLQTSPKWIPGTEKGKPVRVKYNIPISFYTNHPPAQLKQRLDSVNAKIQIRVREEIGTERVRRAGSSPMYVVDGKITDIKDINAIEQNTIHSITVLKGADATAIYGTKGANGVILVTTRKPSEEVIVLPKKEKQ